MTVQIRCRCGGIPCYEVWTQHGDVKHYDVYCDLCNPEISQEEKEAWEKSKK